ncbi:FtsK/SpoIIIE domain-containing protein [Micromonospora sediminimaris]|uniref:Cell division protein FtsK n=1 Tax=Micromonospora sediminimaris TaxID=547162 RepID=A0A9W5UNM5_9ACTN|nr:FtsK/SpoIIIE domain-containing protein [Micromonospora sediminimaris]GIJ31840.1 cell division protein FtsK [Micromonospora sediminimaris]SFB88360.1 FtsK/SpoIIIE family protein [Micromonospora sediminimaris]
MGRLASAYEQAVAAHRAARAHLESARTALSATPPSATVVDTDLLARLARVGAALATPTPGTPLARRPVPVRVGEAVTAGGGFPVLLPLGAGHHLAIDGDARQPTVAGLLRALVLRLLATAAPGGVRVAALDTAALGATFGPLRPLLDAGVVDPPATTEAEVTTLLDAAERHARAARQADRPDQDLLVLVAASIPAPREAARLAALTHAGPAAAVCVLLAGWPPAGPGESAPPLGATTLLRLTDGYARVGDPPGTPFSADGSGLAAPVVLDGDPPPASVAALATHLGEAARRGEAVGFADLLPGQRWGLSGRAGLRTVVGRAGRDPFPMAFDDATPHWLVGGRTGAGKTVFLLDVLYGLAVRYSPVELQLYLLDFKEGVSFTEFVPTERDPSWLPHARAVGIESDREYGVAVLRELRRELHRRATALKRHGVTKLADLPADTPVPRIVAVIDEFHVLLAGNDPLARESADLLEELARKGRSYGVHLVLASQSTTGIEALYGRAEAVFGQFALRVALPGGGGVLDHLNDAAATLPVGSAVVNTAAGAPGANTVIRFPDAHAAADELTRLRHELWQARPAGARPPSVFRGYDTARVEEDATFTGLRPGGRRPLALVGRTVDVDGTTALFIMDTAPGRHLAVVGTSSAGAEVLRAATLSLARQHAPGEAVFVLAPLVAAADPAADDTAATLAAGGHRVQRLDAAALRDRISTLATGLAGGHRTDGPGSAPAGAALRGVDHIGAGAGAAEPGAVPAGRSYLVVFGMDAAAGLLGESDPTTFRSGHDDLRVLLRQGPGHGVHLLGWWRGLRRLADDLGGTQNRDDVACLVALNVPGSDLGLHLGVHDLAYTPRADRALLVDRHDQRVRLIVPFARDGHPSDGQE